MTDASIKRLCEFVGGMALVGVGLWCWTKGWNDGGTAFIVVGIMAAF